MKPALTPVRLADGSATRWPPGRRAATTSRRRAVSYGFGWLLDPWHGRPRMWHHGDTTGFRTVIDRFIDDGLTIVVLCNRDDIDAVALAPEVAGRT